MADNRKGKNIYNVEAGGSQQQQQQQQGQQTVTMHQQQPRVIYSKQMPAVVQQEMGQSNVRIIYAQPPPMQVQMQVPGDPNVRTAYVLQPANQGSEVTLKQERDDHNLGENVRIIYAPQSSMVQMQVQDPNQRRTVMHLNPVTLQVNSDGTITNRSDGVIREHMNPVTLQVNPDGTITNRSEPVMCEVDLRQYQQLQVVQPQHSTADTPVRATTIMQPGQYMQEVHTQVDQSQQTPVDAMSMMPKKKEKVLLPCPHCRDSFRTECQLAAHIRNKHVKPFKCGSCWKAFSFESQLKLHVTTHTGEKPYKCDVCPKAYARKTALFNHVRVHARKKFFKCCKYCGKGFKNEEKLEKHERQHSMGEDTKFITLEMLVEKPV